MRKGTERAQRVNPSDGQQSSEKRSLDSVGGRSDTPASSLSHLFVSSVGLFPTRLLWHSLCDAVRSKNRAG